MWRVLDGAAPGAAPAPGCSPLSPPTLLDADPYTTLDAGDEAATAATLHALADEHAARVKVGAMDVRAGSGQMRIQRSASAGKCVV